MIQQSWDSVYLHRMALMSQSGGNPYFWFVCSWVYLWSLRRVLWKVPALWQVYSQALSAQESPCLCPPQVFLIILSANRVPKPGPQTNTSPWPVREQATQQELAKLRLYLQPFPGLTLRPELRLPSDQGVVPDSHVSMSPAVPPMGGF